jgi:hypothetical protein
MMSVPHDLDDFAHGGEKWEGRHWMNVPGPF